MLNSDNFVWNIPCAPVSVLSGQTVLSSKEVTGSVRKGISDFCLICYYNNNLNCYGVTTQLPALYLRILVIISP